MKTVLPGKHWPSRCNLVTCGFTSWQRLDPASRRQWELESSGSTDLKSINELRNFINCRVQALESAYNYNATNKDKVAEKQVNYAEIQLQSYKSSLSQCICCSATDHQLYQCSRFLAMDVNARNELVRRNKVCFNCMRKGRGTKDCKSKGACKHCARRHNSLLHDEQRQQSTDPKSNNATNACHQSSSFNTVLLPTAMIPIKQPNNEIEYCRAMLDSGAQVCMITERSTQFLGLPKQQCTIDMSGIISSKKLNTSIVSLLIVPENKALNVKAVVMPKFTDLLPTEQINVKPCVQMITVELADPSFNTPKHVDMIIGWHFWRHHPRWQTTRI